MPSNSYGSIQVNNEAQSLLDSKSEQAHQNGASSSTRSSKYLGWTVGALLVIALIAGIWRTSSRMTESDMEKDVEYWYTSQKVDHFSTKDGDDDPSTWSHRYYEDGTYFGGPGNPIFVIV